MGVLISGMIASFGQVRADVRIDRMPIAANRAWRDAAMLGALDAAPMLRDPV